MTKITRVLAATIPFLLAACDPGWVVALRVNVTPAAQAAVATPAEVVVRIDALEGGVNAAPARLGIVCTPQRDVLSFTYHPGGDDCIGRAHVKAWIRPLPPGTVPSACGALEIPETPAFDEPGGYPRAEEIVFEGVAGTSCGPGLDAATLDLDVR